MEQLTNQVAVVTGAASGIGRAMARRFAAAGMKLVLADIENAPLEAVAEELRAGGSDVATRRTDVSEWSEVSALADLAFDSHGAVHLVCNNAGVVMRGQIWDIALEDWNWVIGVDLWSVVYGIKAFVPRMIAGGQPGHVVNTASTAGLFAYAGIAPYNVAKVGVVALSETLHHDLRLAGSSIGVSVLCPGLVATRIGESERNRPGSNLSVTPSVLGPAGSRPPMMTPESVADQVLDAVVGNRFWIITHDAFQARLEARYDAILRREIPEAGVAM